MSESRNATVLPLKDSPLIGFLRWPYTLSITSLDEKSLGWFYSNFIQVYTHRYFYERNLEFNFNFFRGKRFEFSNNNPFLVTTRLGTDILSALGKEITEFYMQSLDLGYYVVAFIDERCISTKEAYQKFHLPHHLLIYGYDLEKKVFYANGFNDNWLYRSEEIPFREIAEGYQSIIDLRNSGAIRDHPDESNFLFKFNPLHNYAFDKHVVAGQLVEYLESRSSIDAQNYNNDQEVFGLETYDFLKFYYDLYLRDAEFKKNGFVRNLHVLWEHKKIMLERIQFLQDHGWIARDRSLWEEYEAICKKALVLRNLAIKHTVSNDESCIVRIRDSFDALKQKDEKAIEALLKALS